MRSRLYGAVSARSFILTPEQLVAGGGEQIGYGTVPCERLWAVARTPDHWESASVVGPWTRQVVKMQYDLEPDLFLVQEKQVQRLL